MFTLLFADVVFEHFKLKTNLSHEFTPADYFKKFSVAIEGLVMGLLKVQGPSMTGLFTTKGVEVEKIVASSESVPLSIANSSRDADDDASSFRSSDQDEEDEGMNNENTSADNIDLDSTDPVDGPVVIVNPKKQRKKGYKKPQMDNHREDHARYSQEAYERRKLILLHCNKKKNSNSGAQEIAGVVEAVDEVEQKEAYMVHTWYLKAIERVSELRQIGKTHKKRKAPMITQEAVKKPSNDWLGSQNNQTYDDLDGNPVQMTAV
jgi:hypothetical protein